MPDVNTALVIGPEVRAGFNPPHPNKDEAVLCWGSDCSGDGKFGVPFGKGRCQLVMAFSCRCMRVQQCWNLDA